MKKKFASKVNVVIFKILRIYYVLSIIAVGIFYIMSDLPVKVLIMYILGASLLVFLTTVVIRKSKTE